MNELVHLLVGVLTCAALGTAVDRLLLPLEDGAARWPVRVLLGVVTIYLVLGLPVFGAVALCAALLVRWRSRARAPNVSSASAPHTVISWRFVIGVLIVIALLVATRPPIAMYWDEYVWLAKARLGAPDPRVLVGEALTAGTNVVPIAYPLLHPLAVSSLAGLSSQPSAVVLGAEALTICVASIFVLSAAELGIERRMRGSLVLAGLLSAAPLVLVHLRSAYVDLETGLLAAGALLLLEQRRPRTALVLALAVVGLKDEGIAHVLAITAASFFFQRRADRRSARAALVVLLVALGSFGAWHVRIFLSGVGQPDHALGLPRIARAPLVLSLLLQQATDIVSWGPLWIAVVSLLLATALRFVTLDAVARTRLVALTLQAAFLFGAIVAGSDRVVAFAESGTLVPRLLVQLVPMASLVLASALATPDSAVTRVTPPRRSPSRSPE